MKDEVWEFKRERILDVSISLFAQYGFQGVSIDKIAKSLKVTKPFIYTYYRNKDAILEEIFVRAVDNILKGADTIFNENSPPEARLKSFIEYYVLENIDRADITAIFLNEEKYLPEAARKNLRKQHHAFDSKLAGLIEEGVASGVFEVEDPMLSSLAISGMVRWVHRWYRPDGRYTPHQLAEKMSKIALNSVAFGNKRKRAGKKVAANA